MIIDEFYVVRIAVTPPKAYSPLLVDSDAMLPRAIAHETFQSVAGRNAKIAQLLGGIQKQQLSQRGALQPH